MKIRQIVGWTARNKPGMREAMFIKKNAENGRVPARSPTDNPDETAERLLRLSTISYAKTFYPHPARLPAGWMDPAGIYQSIYQNKKKSTAVFSSSGNGTAAPVQTLSPHLFFYHHLFPAVLWPLVFFIHEWWGFIRGVLGDNYVNMTEENIAKGDPLVCIKDDNPFSMFVRIAFNNIKVSFSGLFWIYSQHSHPVVMWQKRAHAGCFQYMFFSKGWASNPCWWSGFTAHWKFLPSYWQPRPVSYANGILFPALIPRIHLNRAQKMLPRYWYAWCPFYHGSFLKVM